MDGFGVGQDVMKGRSLADLGFDSETVSNRYCDILANCKMYWMVGGWGYVVDKHCQSIFMEVAIFNSCSSDGCTDPVCVD